MRDKRLHRYYLNGNDAYRLKLWFKDRARRGAAQVANTTPFTQFSAPNCWNLEPRHGMH